MAIKVRQRVKGLKAVVVRSSREGPSALTTQFVFTRGGGGGPPEGIFRQRTVQSASLDPGAVNRAGGGVKKRGGV